MTASVEADALLIGRIRAGDADAWYELIARFEGRLLAFVESRTRHRSAAEDLVQETFIGFLTSLPNFDGRRPLEGYLFSIAAHKLIDYLRREGRRPMLPLVPPSSAASSWEPAGAARPASSIARSGERHHLEEEALAAALTRQIEHFRRAASGSVCNAPSCCSSAAGRTRPSPRGWASPSRRSPTTSSSSSPPCGQPSDRSDCRRRFFQSCIRVASGQWLVASG